MNWRRQNGSTTRAGVDFKLVILLLVVNAGRLCGKRPKHGRARRRVLERTRRARLPLPFSAAGDFFFEMALFPPPGEGAFLARTRGFRTVLIFPETRRDPQRPQLLWSNKNMKTACVLSGAVCTPFRASPPPPSPGKLKCAFLQPSFQSQNESICGALCPPTPRASFFVGTGLKLVEITCAHVDPLLSASFPLVRLSSLPSRSLARSSRGLCQRGVRR